jgi:hypothetical protein
LIVAGSTETDLHNSCGKAQFPKRAGVTAGALAITELRDLSAGYCH